MGGQKQGPIRRDAAAEGEGEGTRTARAYATRGKDGDGALAFRFRFIQTGVCALLLWRHLLVLCGVALCQWGPQIRWEAGGHSIRGTGRGQWAGSLGSKGKDSDKGQ